MLSSSEINALGQVLNSTWGNSQMSDSVKLIKDYIKEVKKRFKEISGRTLKTKELNTRDSVELITTSPYTPRKTGYYRRFTDFQVE